MSKTIDTEDTCYTVEGLQGRQFTIDAIIIEPLPEDLLQLRAHHSIACERASDAITIVPHKLSPEQLEQGMNPAWVDVDPLPAKPMDHCIVHHATKAVTPLLQLKLQQKKQLSRCRGLKAVLKTFTRQSSSKEETYMSYSNV
jgi:hypothetical protein